MPRATICRYVCPDCGYTEDNDPELLDSKPVCRECDTRLEIVMRWAVRLPCGRC